MPRYAIFADDPPDYSYVETRALPGDPPVMAPGTGKRFARRLAPPPAPAGRHQRLAPVVPAYVPGENSVDRAIAAKTAAEALAERRAELAALRFRHETKGIVVGGVAIATDRESQDLIDACQRALADEVIASVDFKTRSGTIVACDLQLADTLRAAVVAHVQACRTREAALDRALAAAAGGSPPGSAAAVYAVDLTKGWPPT